MLCVFLYVFVVALDYCQSFLLLLDNLKCFSKIEDEEIVYESVLRWLMHDIANRASCISEVFSYIRFVLLKEDYL